MDRKRRGLKWRRAVATNHRSRVKYRKSWDKYDFYYECDPLLFILRMLFLYFAFFSHHWSINTLQMLGWLELEKVSFAIPPLVRSRGPNDSELCVYGIRFVTTRSENYENTSSNIWYFYPSHGKIDGYDGIKRKIIFLMLYINYQQLFSTWNYNSSNHQKENRITSRPNESNYSYSTMIYNS